MKKEGRLVEDENPPVRETFGYDPRDGDDELLPPVPARYDLPGSQWVDDREEILRRLRPHVRYPRSLWVEHARAELAREWHVREQTGSVPDPSCAFCGRRGRTRWPLVLFQKVKTPENRVWRRVCQRCAGGVAWPGDLAPVEPLDLARWRSL